MNISCCNFMQKVIQLLSTFSGSVIFIQIATFGSIYVGNMNNCRNTQQLKRQWVRYSYIFLDTFMQHRLIVVFLQCQLGFENSYRAFKQISQRYLSLKKCLACLNIYHGSYQIKSNQIKSNLIESKQIESLSNQFFGQKLGILKAPL